jgi:copper oxidase (laccase) domain-containing protein
MPFKNSADIRYFQFDLFDRGLTQAVFTRRGGVSTHPWTGLNLGGTVGDDPESVRRNRQLALEAIGRGPATVFDVWQVHGTEVVTIHYIADAFCGLCAGTPS